MLAILSLVQQLLNLGIGGERRHISGINLNTTGIAASLFGLAAAVAAMIFLMVGLQGWLAMVINSPYAVPLSWACCGIIAFAVAGTSILVARRAKREHGLLSLAYSTRAPHRDHHPAQAGLDDASHAPAGNRSPFDETAIKAMTDEVAAKIEEHPLASVLIAGLAGIAAGKTLDR